MKRFALIGGIVSGLGTFGIIAYQFSPQIWVFLVGWLVPTLAFGALCATSTPAPPKAALGSPPEAARLGAARGG